MFLTRLFPALAVANYRLYWVTQLIALMGFWIQLTAQQWLVYEMTGSTLRLGFLATVQFTPSLLFTLLAGWFIDRHNKRLILAGTQFFYMVQALSLALLLWSGHASYGTLLCFAFLLGTIDAFDMPARLAFLPELVGKDRLHSAVSLNSANFNITRMAGPVLAAWLLTVTSYGGVFFLNALSLVPILYIYLTMNVTEPPLIPKKTRPLEEIREGLKEALSNRVIRDNLAALAIVSMCILNFGIYGPPFADRILHLGLSGFSAILSAVGAGSLAAGLFSASGWHAKGPFVLPVTGLLCGLLLMIVSQVTLLVPALLLFALLGVLIILFMVHCNTAVQLASPPACLGRIMSLYTLVFLGSAPFGSLLVSSAIEWLGTAGGLFATGLTECVLLLFLFRKKLLTLPLRR